MTLAIQEIIKSQVESTNQFPVDFDEYWQWLGYSRKNNAKRAFIDSDFQEGFDYCLLFNEQSDNHSTLSAQEKSVLSIRENIYLTVDCAKSFAMMSRTAKGKEIRKWYLEIEKELRDLKTKKSEMTLTEIHQLYQLMREQGEITKDEMLYLIFNDASKYLPQMSEAIGRAREILNNRKTLAELPGVYDNESQAMYQRMLNVCIKYADKHSRDFVYARDLAGDAILKRKDFMSKYCTKRAKQLNKPEILLIWQEMHDLGMGIFNKSSGTFELKR
jgi:phage anti-repressor protein